MRRDGAAGPENVLQITAFLCNDNLFLRVISLISCLRGNDEIYLEVLHECK